MSDTLSPYEVTQTDEQDTIDALTRSVVAEMHLKASVGGAAALAVIDDEREISGLHPYYASEVTNLAKHTEHPVALALPDTIGPFNTGYITFNNGVPVGGFASLTLHQDGTCSFSGHFHDSGAPSYNIEFVWVVVDSRGTAYTFTASGRMHGTFESGSRDYNWNQTVVSPLVAQNWPKLVAGWRWQWNAYVNWNVAALVDSVVNALKAAGAVIAVVAPIIAVL